MRLHWLLPSFLGFFLLCSPAQARQLLSWRFDATQNRLVFTTDEGVQPKAQLIADPTRLVIDLPGILLKRSTVNPFVGGAIREVRVGQVDDNTTRLVVELNSGYTINPQQVLFRGLAPNQWMVQLPMPQRVAQLPNSITPSLQIPVPPPATVNPPVVLPTVPKTVGLPTVPKTRLMVMIDPGHGGKDPGAI